MPITLALKTYCIFPILCTTIMNRLTVTHWQLVWTKSQWRGPETNLLQILTKWVTRICCTEILPYIVFVYAIYRQRYTETILQGEILLWTKKMSCCTEDKQTIALKFCDSIERSINLHWSEKRPRGWQVQRNMNMSYVWWNWSYEKRISWMTKL